MAALAASVSGLAVALGSGLVGAAVAATGALGGLAGAFGLVAAPVALLLGHLKDYDDSLDSVKSAEASASSAAQSRAAALKAVSDAQANVAKTARESRQAVADQEEALKQTRADAASSIAQAEADLARARRSGAQGVADAERSLAQARTDASRSIADAERTLQQTRASAASANASAEADLQNARDELASSTRSLSDAQDELNNALRNEPLNQAQATLDLASARDRASDALRDYNEAVAESGRNSEEATDARRELEQANLDLQRTEGEVAEVRRNGSEELQNARDAARSAADEQASSAKAVQDAEQGVVDTRKEGIRQIQDQRRALAQTRTDVGSQITEQERALAQARADRVRGEQEATRAVVEARKEGAQEIQGAEEDLAETSREGAQRVAEAQKQVATAQRAAATAAEAAAAAQKKVREETVRLTPAQKELFDEYKAFQKIANTAFRPAQNAAARLGVEILRLADSYLPRLGAVSDTTIGALSRAFDNFREALARPVEQTGITRYLQLIPALTEVAANAAGRLALALFNVFSRSLRFALPLTRTIGDLADEFLRWTENARGRSAIDRFFEDSTDMGLRLLPIIGDLATGFGNLVSALQRTGIVDQSVRGFASLADSFARSTEAGGGLDKFLRGARELMPFVAQAAKDVGGAILGIAQAAIGARDQGAKLTVLQQIFRGISNAAGPIQRLVVGTFRELGPAIAPLIPQLTRFFGVFAGASGPLVTFVRTLTSALRIFNSLPASVKQAAAQLLALKVILGGLGFTALLAPLGRFASNMFLASRAAGRVAAPLEAAGAAAAASTGRFGRLGSIVKTAGAALLGFARFAGPVAIVLGTIATAAVLVYRNWDRIKAAVQPVTSAFAGFIKQVRPAAQQLIPTLVRTLKSFASGLLSTISPAKTLRGQISDLIGRFAAFVRQAGPPVVAALKSINHWLKENQPLFRTIGRVVGTVLVGAFKGMVAQTRAGIAVVRTIIGVFKNYLGVVRTVITAVSNFGEKVGQGLSDARDRIVDVFKGIPEFIKNAKLGFTSVGAHIIQAIIEGMKPINLAGALIDKVKGAKDKLAFWQQEHSPAKRWMPHGRNAALGYIEAFKGGIEGGGLQRALQDGMVNLGEVSKSQWQKLLDMGWKGRPGDSAERLYAPSGRSQASSRGSGSGNLSARQFSNLPDEQRFALAARGGLPPPPAGYTWAEDYSLVRTSFYGGSASRSSRQGAERMGVALGSVSKKRWEELLAKGWKGNPRDHREMLYPPSRRSERRLEAPTNQQPSKSEWRQMMREAHAEGAKSLAHLIRASMAASGFDPEAMRLLDRKMGGYFNFRNGMGAAPN